MITIRTLCLCLWDGIVMMIMWQKATVLTDMEGAEYMGLYCIFTKENKWLLSSSPVLSLNFATSEVFLMQVRRQGVLII